MSVDIVWIWAWASAGNVQELALAVGTSKPLPGVGKYGVSRRYFMHLHSDSDHISEIVTHDFLSCL